MAELPEGMNEGEAGVTLDLRHALARVPESQREVVKMMEIGRLLSGNLQNARAQALGP